MPGNNWFCSSRASRLRVFPGSHPVGGEENFPDLGRRGKFPLDALRARADSA
jgi:hypothetical protein